MNLRELALTALLLGSMAGSARAQMPGSDRHPNSSLRLIAADSVVRPGSTITIGHHLSLDPGWHTYWINGGDAGFPLEVTWQMPAGFTAGPLLWPAPTLIATPPLMSYGYHDSLVLLTRISVPNTIPVGSKVTLSAATTWLVCEEVCLPARDSVSITLTVGESTVATSGSAAATIAAAESHLPISWPSGAASQAWKSDSGYTLLIDKLDPALFPAPYFFVDSTETLDHARTQRVRRGNRGLALELTGSEFARASTTHLRGVLISDLADANSAAYLVDLVVAPSPDAAATGAMASLGGDFSETGGLAGAATTTSGALPPITDTTSTLGILAALLFAFIGGILLNLMPCVFPVLSLKALSFVELGAGSAGPRVTRQHGMAFTAGVVVSFWLLAGLLFGLRAGGQSLGWGFQLQSPIVVGVLALLLFGLALNMSGVFELGLSLTRLGGIGGGHKLSDSFLTGGLAVIVAAPCTAPFMGSALGFAVVQPALIGLLVFTALAFGLAAPYLLLSMAPALINRLPRPGAWMVRLREFLAFPMYATVIWLVWVFGRQAGVNAVAVMLTALLVVAVAGWLWGQAARSESRVGRVAAAALVVLALFVVATGAELEAATVGAADTALAWEEFSEARLAELRAEGRPVLIDFTAAWCLTCQVNERVALHTKAASEAFTAGNVALLRADWTSRDSVIGKVLLGYGRTGVPLYVFYSVDQSQPPEILPALLTPGIVARAVVRATAVPSAGDGR